LVEEIAIFLLFGILLQPHFVVGGYEDGGFSVSLKPAAGPSEALAGATVATAKPKQNPCFSYFVLKHCLIPGSPLVTEEAPEVRTP
jgi:hypothetical protein